MIDQEHRKLLQEGTVIPAHPLALYEDRSLDEERQRRLTRYYIASGAGGVAVGVHTTQFAIRKPEINLLGAVLRLAAEEIDNAGPGRPLLKIAGVCGPMEQAVREAELARNYGYHLGLLSMGGLQDLSEAALIDRVRAVAAILPIFGFYLQPAVGGRLLSYGFWRAFADIPGVLAIKVAAFNRYHTLDVVRAVCDSSRREEIALYTGNDDHIVGDLLTPYRFVVGGRTVEKRFVGGLLGHWAVWTRKAVGLFEASRKYLVQDLPAGGVQDLLARGIEVTDMNAAIFDVANNFSGCIPGIHEILWRQGLLAGTGCLDKDERLSPGQKEEIDRVCAAYPEHTDDAFVSDFLEKDKQR
jgi:dihydrodipicolinate synthase/N-acetylneuraminate lyase